MHVSRSKVFGSWLCVCACFFLFLNIFFRNGGGYLLYREWCLDIYLLSSSLSENKHETIECVLLWCLDEGHGDFTGNFKCTKAVLWLLNRT